jgi:hypothetical protein
LAIILIGIFLFLIGASGGWPELQLVINEKGWRIALATLGLITFGTGGYLIWRTKEANIGNSYLQKDYGIKITSPSHNKEVRDKFDVEGVYKIKPQKDLALGIFEFSPISRQYYQKRLAQFEEGRKTWKVSSIGIGGKTGDERIIVAVLMGPDGLFLWNYSDKLLDIAHMIKVNHDDKLRIPGLESLFPNMVECDRITLKHKM